MRKYVVIWALAGLALSIPAASSQTTQNSIEPDGTVNVPSFRLPPSVYMSEEARNALPRNAFDNNAALSQLMQNPERVPALRQARAQSQERAIAALREIYPVETRETTIGGIHGYLITPRGGVPARNRGKILINLPGGAFVMGTAAGTGMRESIPIAALGQIEIFTMDYRQAPEARFPAASEDVAAVYRALLEDHRAENVGLFGSSAGGLLTAQAIAWFQHVGLPTPGGAGIFCASGDARWAGDYFHSFQALQGVNAPADLSERFYYGDHDLTDPLMSPALSQEVLRRFPPTLLLTATRAGEMSAAVETHRQLTNAGVNAELHIWDGLNHCFWSADPSWPESREAYAVTVSFFVRSLGRSRARQ